MFPCGGLTGGVFPDPIVPTVHPLRAAPPPDPPGAPLRGPAGAGCAPPPPPPVDVTVPNTESTPEVP